MVFSSFLFLFYFLPLCLAAYYLLPARWRTVQLTLFSYLFYGWTNPLFVPLMWLSTTIDYLAGAIITADRARQRAEDSSRAGGLLPTRRQQLALILSVGSNLALLAYFKYFNFGMASWRQLAAFAGIPDGLPDSLWQVTLPLGISFYTFQSLSYTIDIYRGTMRAAPTFLHFACYVALFPQLVAGPIIRYQDLADQLLVRSHSWGKFARGVLLFELGLAKKVLLANPCGFIADGAFQANSLECLQAWWGLAAYTLQIYFDFSGYSDMAIGLGLMLGFVFPQNFAAPYRARSISEFWRRWHITLSTWLREYVYIPLGGNRYGRWSTYRNLFLVMLLGGLWHGAAWNFVLWGAYHGLWLAGERLIRERRTRENLGGPVIAPTGSRGVWPVLQAGGTLLVVALGWVLFRAADLPQAVAYYGTLAHLNTPLPTSTAVWLLLGQPYHVLTVLAGFSLIIVAPTAWQFTARLTLLKSLLGTLLLAISVVLLASQQYNPFIYFLF